MTDARITAADVPPESNASDLPGILVGPDWLEARLGQSGLSLIDMREVGAYRRAHLPGAAHLELQRLGLTRPGLENVLLHPDDFSDLMEGLGVSSDDVIVVYDDQWGLAAARLLWALHYYGHDRVAVLDGGWDRWQEEGRPTTDAVPDPRRGRFETLPRPTFGASTEWLSTRVGTSETVLVDTRTVTEFEQGHLPGAKLWDWFSSVPPGSWDAARDLDELRSEWAALEIREEHEVVVYCRSGMRAAHTYMVLRHAGYERVRLYDGSWQEWSMTQEQDDGT